jgi:hypothetical protein
MRDGWGSGTWVRLGPYYQSDEDVPCAHNEQYHSHNIYNALLHPTQNAYLHGGARRTPWPRLDYLGIETWKLLHTSPTVTRPVQHRKYILVPSLIHNVGLWAADGPVRVPTCPSVPCSSTILSAPDLEWQQVIRGSRSAERIMDEWWSLKVREVKISDLSVFGGPSQALI